MAAAAAGDDDTAAPVGTEAPTTGPGPALNELPPKAAMKASKLNRGPSFVYESNGTAAASQRDDDDDGPAHHVSDEPAPSQLANGTGDANNNSSPRHLIYMQR